MHTNSQNITFLHLSNNKDLINFREEISLLFYQCFQHHLDEKLWEWGYLNNPLGDSIVNLAFLNNNLVGHYAFIPIATTYYSTLLSMTTMVHQSARKYNIFFDLAQKSYEFARKKNFDFIVGFPNKKSALVHEKLLNWKILPSFVAQCDFQEFVQNSPKISKHNSCMLDIENINFINWRISKPKMIYLRRGDNFYKNFNDCFDILTHRECYELLGFKNKTRVNFITQSKKLEKYKIFDYPFAIKNLQSSLIPNFHIELLISDIF